ncbi:MAG: DinB family protein [Phycisphaeraceae bacterium]|nr:DinB family protein [Phycisphaeraceae bacterium]
MHTTIDHLTRHSTSAALLAAPLADILAELESVALSLTVDLYTRPCGPTFANGSLGAHIRHALDHVRALTTGARTGVVDYDHRDRGTTIESSPAAAVVEIRRLHQAILDLARADADDLLNVRVMPSRGGACVEVESTLGRELAFVLSHTIHHNATVRSMAISLGTPVPATFGYAPSTLAHLDSGRCAR